MVDDFDTAHGQWSATGLEPSPIEHARIHSSLTVRDPDGE